MSDYKDWTTTHVERPPRKKPSPTSERMISAAVRRRLDHYEYTKKIEWFERLQSIKIQHYGNYIHGCRNGTPDYVCVIRNKQRGLTLCFLEVKSPKGKQRPEQKKFQSRYHNDKDILYYIITDHKQVDNIINTLAFDRTTLL